MRQLLLDLIAEKPQTLANFEAGKNAELYQLLCRLAAGPAGCSAGAGGLAHPDVLGPALPGLRTERRGKNRRAEPGRRHARADRVARRAALPDSPFPAGYAILVRDAGRAGPLLAGNPAAHHAAAAARPAATGRRTQAMNHNLTLFDLDHTLLPLDSDYEWGQFISRIGAVDPVEFKRRNG